MDFNIASNLIAHLAHYLSNAQLYCLCFQICHDAFQRQDLNINRDARCHRPLLPWKMSSLEFCVTDKGGTEFRPYCLVYKHRTRDYMMKIDV